MTSESLEAETTFELVTDAYIRVNEVLYGWAKWLNPWQVRAHHLCQPSTKTSSELNDQVNAVKALTNPNALTHPEHPLFDKEQGGLLLFNCERAPVWPATRNNGSIYLLAELRLVRCQSRRA